MAKRILVVDDGLRTLKLVGLILDQQGYDVVAARSSADGLEQARAEKPDLLILDVMMPDLDGFEVAQHLRSDPATTDLPILMLTGRAQLEAGGLFNPEAALDVSGRCSAPVGTL